MLKPKMSYSNLKDSYLFYNISKKLSAFFKENPSKKLFKMGIGDVTKPLTPCVIKALSEAVKEQGEESTFHGYMPECGAPFFRESVARHYQKRGIEISSDEVFVSSGASDELGDILDLFDISNTALICEPAYPAYVDANVMAGRKINRLISGEFNNFLPLPDENTQGDIIYLCSPSNPTGAVYDREQLKIWVDFANRNGSVILFDAAYEAFIEEDDLPRSIFEIEGAKECAIEICSLSKTAGFTGTRLGYTVIPKNLQRCGMNLNDMWVRNRTTKTNGVSYILQRGGAAVFSDEGQREVAKLIRGYKENAEIVMRALDEVSVKYYGGKNSPYIWMQCPDKMGSWQFFDYLLNEVQVIGTPGEGFGKCGEGYFRFSMFSSDEVTKEAARRIVIAIKKLSKK